MPRRKRLAPVAIQSNTEYDDRRPLSERFPFLKITIAPTTPCPMCLRSDDIHDKAMSRTCLNINDPSMYLSLSCDVNDW